MTPIEEDRLHWQLLLMLLVLALQLVMNAVLITILVVSRS